MPTVDVTQRIAAPAERVWEILSDHERMPDWASPIRTVTLERAGRPERNGLGAVRRIEAPLQKMREEVIAWDPPRSFDYTMLSGAPVRTHHGRLEVSPDGGGCVVRWHVTFTPKIPLTGTAMALTLNLAFGRMLAGLAAFVEKA